MIIRILSRLEKIIEDTRESFTTEMKELETSQAEIKNSVTEMQDQLDAKAMRMDETEE